MLVYNIKIVIISVISIIFTSFLFIHWIICRILKSVFGILPSYLMNQLSYNLDNYRFENIRISYCIQTVINSCLSMISALMIIDYTHKFINLIQIISHQVHKQFLGLVLPQFPQIWPQQDLYLIYIYLILGYLGLSTQIAFTLDMLYIFNIPTIFIYKILAFLYQIILKSIYYLYQVLTQDINRWITCQKRKKWIITNIKPIKIICLGLLVFLLHALLFVSFYYLWLAIVIISLTIFMEMIKIFLSLTKQMGNIICIVKGYHKQIEQKGKKRLLKETVKQVLLQTQINIKIIRDIFIGKDIMRLPKINIFNDYSFSIKETYFCFTKVKL